MWRISAMRRSDGVQQRSLRGQRAVRSPQLSSRIFGSRDRRSAAAGVQITAVGFFFAGAGPGAPAGALAASSFARFLASFLSRFSRFLRSFSVSPAGGSPAGSKGGIVGLLCGAHGAWRRGAARPREDVVRGSRWQRLAHGFVRRWLVERQRRFCAALLVCYMTLDGCAVPSC